MDIKGAFKRITGHKSRERSKEIERRMQELKLEEQMRRSQSDIFRGLWSEAVDNLNKKLKEGESQ